MVPDRLIPGTLNVGHTLPDDRPGLHLHLGDSGGRADAVRDDHRGDTRVPGSALAWYRSWSKQRVQFGMGAALLVAATLLLITQLRR